MHQLILKNRATGRVVRIAHDFTGLPREGLNRVCRDRNEREGRTNRNTVWTVRRMPVRGQA